MGDQKKDCIGPYKNFYTHKNQKVLQECCTLAQYAVIETLKPQTASKARFKKIRFINENKYDPYFLKYWVVPRPWSKPKSYDESLKNEWIIYGLVTSFFYIGRYSIHFLFSVERGMCVSEKETLYYNLLPHIPQTVATEKKSIDLNIVFIQMAQTLATCANLGFRHNDAHLNNWLVSYKPCSCVYDTGTTLLHLKWPYTILLGDFDRSVILEPMATVLRSVAGKTLSNGKLQRNGRWCVNNNQCNDDTEGRWDWVQCMFNILYLTKSSEIYIPIRRLIISELVHTTHGAIIFKKYFKLNPKNSTLTMKKKDRLDYEVYQSLQPDSLKKAIRSPITFFKDPNLHKWIQRFLPQNHIDTYSHKNNIHVKQAVMCSSGYGVDPKNLLHHYESITASHFNTTVMD